MAPPSGAVPPPLAPTVEEAYRRKCIQLKQRINEVDHDNESARIRVVRLERGVQKLRLERAFLLEQLAKRTSTNVEDSDGSPSPPPTPKEKPLRTKRGHRKPSFLTNLNEGSGGSAFIQQGATTLSPSSDAFSHTHPDSHLARNSTPQAAAPKRLLPANGAVSSAPGPPAARKPKSAFEIYCNDTRTILVVANRAGISEGTYDVEEGLARGWRDLNEEQKAPFQARFEEIKRNAAAPAAPPQAVFDGESRPPRPTATVEDVPDEDVEMVDDGLEPSAAAQSGGGFTAVNSS